MKSPYDFVFRLQRESVTSHTGIAKELVRPLFPGLVSLTLAFLSICVEGIPMLTGTRAIPCVPWGTDVFTVSIVKPTVS